MNSTTGLSLISLFLIIFCPICVIYFALAMGYFFFFDPPTNEDTINKDFYGLTISSTKTIPYEVKSQTARKISSEDVSKTIIESDTKTKNLDGANYNLVNSIRK